MADKDMQEELQTIKDDVAKLRSDIADLVGLLKDLGAEKVGEAKTTVEEELRAQREKLRRALGSAKERGKRTADDIEETITQHPLSSLLAAFGVGFILAKLTNGGRSESSR